MARRIPVWLGAWLAAALAACEADPVTQLVVVVRSDMAVPDELDAFTVRVLAPDGATLHEATYALGDGPGRYALPADFGVAPRGGDPTRRVTVEIDAVHEGARLFTNRARTTFLRGRTLRLEMFLARRCLDLAAMCGDDESCRREGCVPVDVDPRDLPEHEEGQSTFGLAAGSAGIDILYDLATDSRGVTYAVGTFQDTISFEGMTWPGTGTETGFLVALAPDGTPLWSHVLNTPAAIHSTLRGVDVGPDGRVYVAGFYDGTIDWLPGETTEAQDGLVACLSRDGALVWARRLGGGLNVQPNDVDAGASRIAIAGLYAGDVDFGGGSLPIADGDDAFVAVLDLDGAHVWSARATGPGLASAEGVALGRDGAVVAVGHATDGIALDGGPSTVVAGTESFVAGWSADGAARWLRTFPGEPSYYHAHRVVLDRAGLAYAAGTFIEHADFGGGLRECGNYCGFVVSYAADGTYRWDHVAAPGTGADGVEGDGIALGPAGEIAITGHTHDPVLALAGATFETDTATDAYVAIFDAAGALLEVQIPSSTATEEPRALAFAADGRDVVIGGMFTDGPGVFDTRSFDNAGAQDLFILRVPR